MGFRFSMVQESYVKHFLDRAEQRIMFTHCTQHAMLFRTWNKRDFKGWELPVILALSEALTHFGHIYPDSADYIALAHVFERGHLPNGTTVIYRYLQPVIPFAAASLNFVIKNIVFSFAILNMILWCGATVLVFELTFLLTGRREPSVLAASYFAAAVPLLVYGDAVLTDMGGYFFMILSVYLLVRLKMPKASLSRILVSSMILTLGILTRETNASYIIIFVILLLLSRKWSLKIIPLLGIPAFLSLLWSSIVGVSYWNAYLVEVNWPTHQPLTIAEKAIAILYTLRLAFRPELLVLAAIGFLYVCFTREGIVTYISVLLGGSVFLLAIPAVDYRWTFILFPSMMPLAGLGTMKLASTVAKRMSGEKCRTLMLTLEVLIMLCVLILTNWTARSYIAFP